MPADWTPDPSLHSGDERSLTFARRQAGPFSIRLRAYRSDFQQPTHEHDISVIDLNLWGSGRGAYGRIERLSRAGEVEFFAAGKPHSFVSGPRGIRTMHILVADGDDLASGDECGDFDGARALRAAVGVLRSVRGGVPWDAVHTESLCWELLGEVTEGGLLQREAPPVWLARVRAMLHDITDRAVGLEELAAEAGIHRGTLARGFRAAMGCTPGEYHRRIRLAAAARYLADGRDAALAALDAGFADHAHLIRWFGREVGVTPHEFRRALGAGK